MDREMMLALMADGEMLRSLTGEDHGPHFFDEVACPGDFDGEPINPNGEE